jgi:hypothetical protein
LKGPSALFIVFLDVVEDPVNQFLLRVPEASFDHGVYADGDGLTLRGNVVRHNTSYGLDLYPSIKNSLIVNNLVYDQVRQRAIIVACPEGGGRNVIVNNTVAEDQPLAIWNGNGEGRRRSSRNSENRMERCC